METKYAVSFFMLLMVFFLFIFIFYYFFNNNNNFDAEFGSVFAFAFSFVNRLWWWCSIYSSQLPSTWRWIKGEFFLGKETVPSHKLIRLFTKSCYTCQKKKKKKILQHFIWRHPYLSWLHSSIKMTCHLYNNLIRLVWTLNTWIWICIWILKQ